MFVVVVVVVFYNAKKQNKHNGSHCGVKPTPFYLSNVLLLLFQVLLLQYPLNFEITAMSPYMLFVWHDRPGEGSF